MPWLLNKFDCFCSNLTYKFDKIFSQIHQHESEGSSFSAKLLTNLFTFLNNVFWTASKIKWYRFPLFIFSSLQKTELKVVYMRTLITQYQLSLAQLKRLKTEKQNIMGMFFYTTISSWGCQHCEETTKKSEKSESDQGQFLLPCKSLESKNSFNAQVNHEEQIETFRAKKGKTKHFFFGFYWKSYLNFIRRPRMCSSQASQNVFKVMRATFCWVSARIGIRASTTGARTRSEIMLKLIYYISCFKKIAKI